MSKILASILSNRYILLLAIIYSSIILVFSPVNLPIGDDAKYAELASNLVSNGHYQSNFESDASTLPFYPVLLAASLLAFNGLYMKFLPFMIAFFLILTTFFLALEMTENRKTAYITALITLTIPLIIFNSMRILTDVTFLLFLLLSMLFYFKLQKKRNTKNALFLGIFLGIACLTRFIGIFIPIIIILHALFLCPKKPMIPLKYILLFLIVAAVVYSPWLFWKINLGSFSEPEIVNAAFSTDLQGHFVLLIETLSSTVRDLSTNIISIDVAIPFQVVHLARILVILLILISPVISFVVLYQLYKFISKRTSLEYFLFLWFFVFVIFHIFYPASLASRFLLPVVFPMVLLSSLFIINHTHRKKLIALFIILHILLVSGSLALDSHVRWSKLQTTAFADTGAWLETHTPPNSVILPLGVPATSINFYGQRRTVTLESNTSADFVIFSNFALTETAFNQIVEERAWELSELKTFSDNKYTVTLYKLE